MYLCSLDDLAKNWACSFYAISNFKEYSMDNDVKSPLNPLMHTTI